VEGSVRAQVALAASLALASCNPSEPPRTTSDSEPRPRGFALSAEDAERLKARIDQNPRQAVRLLEDVIATSTASMTEQQFEEFRAILVELLDEGRIQRLVRAGREVPATSPEVARLIHELEAWDASIIRGADVPSDLGYSR
jgi:hypothetical protein